MAILSRTFPHPVSSLYTCEICGQEVNDVEVVSYILSLALPGKNGVIPSFGCSAEQHHGCCEEHAWQAVVACHDEHIKQEHARRHQRVEQNDELMAQVRTLHATHHQRPAWKLQPITPPPAPDAHES